MNNRLEEWSYGISPQRHNELQHLAQTHLGAIGLEAPSDFLEEIDQLPVDYFGEPVIIFPEVDDQVSGQEQFIF